MYWQIYFFIRDLYIHYKVTDIHLEFSFYYFIMIAIKPFKILISIYTS